jgi:metallo-beta-lactamase family protein
MCDAGRIKHHLKHNLWKSENTVLFVGYQAFGTLGRMITEGKKTVRIHGDEVSVEAEIQQIHGYSGHADQAGLLDWLSHIKKVNGRVFVTHGEQDSAAELVRIIKEKFKFDAIAPGLGETFDLMADAVEVVPAAEVVRQPVRVDSHNLYAELMLKLADFMRSNHDENKRREKLESLLKGMN